MPTHAAHATDISPAGNLGGVRVELDLSASPAVAELSRRMDELSKQLVLAMTAVRSPWLRREEAAQHLRVSPRTLDSLRKAKRVRSTFDAQFPGLVLFKREWLDEYLESIGQGGGGKSRSTSRAQAIVDRARAGAQG
jgi:hypothetical protein